MHGVPGSGEEGEATDDKTICPKGYIWKISSTLNTNGHTTITAIDYLPPTRARPSPATRSTPGLASPNSTASYLSGIGNGDEIITAGE